MSLNKTDWTDNLTIVEHLWEVSETSSVLVETVEHVGRERLQDQVEYRHAEWEKVLRMKTEWTITTTVTPPLRYRRSVDNLVASYTPAILEYMCPTYITLDLTEISKIEMALWSVTWTKISWNEFCSSKFLKKTIQHIVNFV